MRNIFAFLLISVFTALMAGCIEDGFTSSPSHQPSFSTDTLSLGVVFTEEPTPTSRFMVYNRHDKSLLISDIRLSGDDAGAFRINVDGINGTSFADVEVRARDSVFVFVEATVPELDSDKASNVEAKVDFTTNGVVNSVVLKAVGQNVTRLRCERIAADSRLEATRPYVVYDSLVVEPDATLTLGQGTTLCFHDGARLVVHGSLVAEGTSEAPVVMAGDRTGNVVADISFDIMSRQWDGVYFTSTSRGNSLSNTEIKNTVNGVCVDEGSEPVDLTMLNCRLHNSAATVLAARHASVDATGCEFAEGGGGLVSLHGGKHRFNHCTFGNNYLFSFISGPALAFSHLSADAETGEDDGTGRPYINALVTNSIIYGLGSDLSHGDLTGTDVRLHRCLLRSTGSDDDNFTECLWGEHPLYHTVRSEYIFDYRLCTGSPAIQAADTAYPAPADAYGLERGTAPELGAYVFVPEFEES